ncbi:unnamed protein product [Vitrella brassicaformis CCMP3155]|uniref:Uncharacterized protein n=2 Tax=Vitrella brassicaformis TaxID=1169539 RepID=A0A0G4FF41_VITBC|nr:unnamed protein product [Vitrella brassicaformis CCMP3155]|mmetsp:Transcript_52042/g.130743  ORF Transcript_52042/g.130743 Transcript_52042/m.130743 type:complete len:188 (+) Transcript_52042:129-692(+)|eukprot:CEM11805.1 unnamed protein product [Vitrella brassicaformis CCMP3155]
MGSNQPPPRPPRPSHAPGLSFSPTWCQMPVEMADRPRTMVVPKGKSVMDMLPYVAPEYFVKRRIDESDYRYLRMEGRTGEGAVVKTHATNPEQPFNTVGDYKKVLANLGDPETVVVIGWERAADDTPIGDTGKTEDNPVVFRRVVLPPPPTTHTPREVVSNVDTEDAAGGVAPQRATQREPRHHSSL